MSPGAGAGATSPHCAPLLARGPVLGPAAVFGTGPVCYFGDATAGMIGSLIGAGTGFTTGEGYTAAFLWTVVPAYLLWGVGLSVAAVSYGVRTRPRCRWCGYGRTGIRQM